MNKEIIKNNVVEEKKEIKVITGNIMENGTDNEKALYLAESLNRLGIINLTKEEMKLFIDYCIMENLNPIRKQAYVSVYADKSGKRNMSIITAYQVYVQRAFETNDIEEPPMVKILNEFVLDEKGNMKFNEKGSPIKTPLADVIAEFSVKRKSHTKPFTKIFRMSEFHKGQSTWVSMPYFMFEKCCLANGIRLAFPLETGKLTYIAEEQWKREDLKTSEKIIQEEIKTKHLLGEKENINGE